MAERRLPRPDFDLGLQAMDRYLPTGEKSCEGLRPFEASHGEKVWNVNDLVAGKVERPHLVECREGRAQREQLVARQRQFLEVRQEVKALRKGVQRVLRHVE